MTPLPVAEALARVLDGVRPLERETASLSAARGRVLAENLVAKLTQPPFDASAMDGWAVRAADVANALATLAIIGESAAGRPFAGIVGAGQAVRISTGAPVPDGADTVVIQENTRREGDRLVIEEPEQAGANVRPRGGDFSEGQTVGTVGLYATPRLIGLAAAMGYADLRVTRKPVVAILATGDELVSPGTAPAPSQIVSSIPHGLAAMVEGVGGEARLLGIAPDSSAALSAKVREAEDADILVTVGGASVGDHDLVKPALKDAGFSLDFWKIAMRPGKPLLFGRRDGRRVVGLPGNPVSAFVCARVFLVPLIHALLGVTPAATPSRTSTLANGVPANGPRTHYMRAKSSPDPGGARVSVFPSQDSSLMTALALADCLVVRRPDAPEAKAGETVEIMDIDF